MSASRPLARDLMTTEVITVPPEMPIAAIAHLLTERSVSAVPVTDTSCHLMGLVTEADLIRRIAATEDKPKRWFSVLFDDLDADARTYARTHGKTARDVMTTDVVTVTPDTTAARCAALMEERGIKRLPVVVGRRLVGLVARGDLLRAALDQQAPLGTNEQSPDTQIRALLRREMRRESWADSYFAFADVKDGIVRLDGYVRSEAIRRALHVMARRIEGVTDVEDHLQIMPLILGDQFIR